MEQKTKAYVVLVGELKGERKSGQLIVREDDNIKEKFKERV
jgi:hypothetical protein